MDMKKRDVVENDADGFKKSSPVEHVRMFPAMYLSSKGENGVFQTVKEVISNSIDECLSGFGKKIEVTLHTPTKISVRDYGRGIPVSLNNKYGQTGLELAIELNTGGKNGGGKLYNTSFGMHGVGLGATCAVSKYMKCTVWKDGLIQSLEASKGVKIIPAKMGVLTQEGTTKETGTEITWELDPTVMTVTEFGVDRIKKHLQTSSFLSSGVEFVFIDKRHDKVEETSYLSKNGLVDFVNTLIDGRDVLLKKPVTMTAELPNGDKVEATFQFMKSFETSIHLCVNSNVVPNGGTPLIGFRQGLVRAVNTVAKTLNILKEKDKGITTSDIDEGLVAIVSMTMSEIEAEGQTKNQINNESARTGVYNATVTNMTDYLEDQVLVLSEIVQKCLAGRRAREAASRARKAIIDKEMTKTSGPSKLKDCISKKASECELYLVEGDSAAGNLLPARYVNTQAYLPLRGKVLNIESQTVQRALENNEIRSIIHALGAGYGEDFDVTKINYGKLIILADADPDGAHIRALIITFIFKLMPDLIKEGHLYSAIPPLYKIKQGKDKIDFYITAEDYKSAVAALRAKGKKPGIDYISSRFKGLGEMMSDDLRDACMNVEKRHLVKITIPDVIAAEEVVRKLMAKEEVVSRKKFYLTRGEEL